MTGADGEPRLSVLLLCWNHARHLEQCIGSLAAQSSNDFEVLFLDNASTDGSYELAAEMLRDHCLPHRLFRNEKPEGIARNLNKLRAAASGELIAPLSGDDWYHPRFVEAMLASAARHPEAGLLYPGGWLYFEAEDRLELVDIDRKLSGDVLIPLLEGRDPIFFIGCCYPKRVLDDLGGWDEALQIEDLDLFIRLTLKHPVRMVPEHLVYYRRSSATASANVDFMVAGWEQYFRKYEHFEHFDMKAWMAERYRIYAAVLANAKRTGPGLRLLWKSLKLKPLNPKAYRTLLYLIRAHRWIGRAPALRTSALDGARH